MKHICYILLIALILTGCTQKENNFNTLASGLEYCFIIENSDSSQANPGDAWILDVKYYDNNDSLLFNSDYISSNFTMECPADSMLGCVEEGLKMMHNGDSIIIKADAERFYTISRGIELPPSIKKGEKLTFYAKCKGIIPEKTIEKQFGEYISKMMANEKYLITNYIEREEIDAAPSITGLYKIILTPGKGTTTAENKTVTVNYIGMFIEGTEFDNSYKRKRPLTFQLGKGLVIQGWEEGIASMKKGEKARFIVPSNLAYGVKGTKGIPPFSTLIFDIEMIDFK